MMDCQLYYKEKVGFINKVLFMTKKESLSRKNKKTYIISLGGSLIVPDEVNFKKSKKRK